MIRVTDRATETDLPRVLTPLFILTSVIGSSMGLMWLLSRGNPADALWLVGGAIAILVFLNPVRGAYLVALSIPIQSVLLLGGDVTIARGLTLLAVSAWLLRILIMRDPIPPLLSSSLFKIVFLFALFAFASLLWAEHFSSAITEFLTTLQLIGLAVMIAGIVTSWRQLEWVFRFLVLGGITAAIITIVQFLVIGAARAGGDVSGGLNQTSMYLVILVPAALYVMRSPNAGIWRLIGFGFLIVAPLAVLGTFSRSTFLIMPLVALVGFWQMARDGGRNLLYLILAGVGLGILLLAFAPWERVGERGESIGSVLSPNESNSTQQESSRMQHWLGGILIFKDYPVAGVGYGNFGYRFVDYQHEVPAKYFKETFRGKFRSPHSTVLGILSELGIIGMLLLTGIFIAAWRNLKVSNAGHERRTLIFIQALKLALVTYVIFSFVNVTDNGKLLWLLLGLTEVLRQLTTSSSRVPDDDDFHPIQGRSVRSAKGLARALAPDSAGME